MMGMVVALVWVAQSYVSYEPSVAEVRYWYQQAEKKEQNCRYMLSKLQGYSENNHPLFAGYKGCATMMMAKHCFNPVSKLSWFLKGKNQLEAALNKDPRNVELRFLRFANQTSIPAFLGYHDEIESDKIYLLQSVPRLNDQMLKKQVIEYMQQSKYVSEKEKKYLNE